MLMYFYLCYYYILTMRILLLLKFLQFFLNCCRVELAKKSLTLKVIYDVIKSMDKDGILIKEV